jgi:hypothetical protein
MGGLSEEIDADFAIRRLAWLRELQPVLVADGAPPMVVKAVPNRSRRPKPNSAVIRRIGTSEPHAILRRGSSSCGHGRGPRLPYSLSRATTWAASALVKRGARHRRSGVNVAASYPVSERCRARSRHLRVTARAPASFRWGRHTDALIERPFVDAQRAGVGGARSVSASLRGRCCETR